MINKKTKEELTKQRQIAASRNTSKFSSAKDEDYVPRRSFIKSDISSSSIPIGEDNEIVGRNSDRYGNIVFKDKLGNVKCYSKEDQDNGIVPDLSYQSKYQMETSITKDGDVQAEITSNQEAFYETLKDRLSNAIAIDDGSNFSFGLPLGKKIKNTNALPEAEDMQKSAQSSQTVLKKEAADNHQEELETKNNKIIITCSSCNNRLNSIEYRFCPHCGTSLR